MLTYCTNRALQLYNAAIAAAQTNQNPVLPIGERQLAPYCRNARQLALLAMPGNPVAFVRDCITPAQVRAMLTPHINELLIQSYGILVEDFCGECCRRGLTPFPDCRRVEGQFGNSCGNCKWRDHGIRCVRSDRPCRISRRCNSPPPPVSPDESPTPPPSAAPRVFDGRSGSRCVSSGSAAAPIVID